MPSKKILIIAEVFSENLGDGVIYESLRNSIIKNHPKYIINKIDLSGNKDWCSHISTSTSTSTSTILLQKLKKIPILKKIYYTYNWYAKTQKACFPDWVFQIKNSDAIVIGGGQLFTDNNFGFPPKIFDVYRLCKKYKKPLYILGCGVGDHWSLPAKFMYQKVINYARFISVRDESSRKNIFKYTKVNSVTHPDFGFSINRNNLISKENEGSILYLNLQPLEDFKYFVPTLKELTESAYFDFWENIIKVCYCNYQISLITNGHIDDYNVVVRLYNRLLANGYEKVTLQPRATKPDELIEQIKNCNYIISTRMHAGIIAYSLGKCVIPISWDQKVNNVWLEMTNRSDIVLDSSVLNKKLTLSEIESLFNNSIKAQGTNLKNAINTIDEILKNNLTY
ncbi:polysaccharide pyruvyl transferase family protein [Providencia rettgeri]|nr:polysaccharide pyruvyl transferase family protein [Providencia rettgeri]